MYSVESVAVTSNQKRWQKYKKPQTAKENQPNSTEASKRSQHLKRVRALMLLGGKCAECGITDMRVLHIDHKDNDGAIHRKQVGRNAGVIRDVFRTPEKFQILCANCHEIKHTKERL